MSAIRMSNALLPRRMGLAPSRSSLCATIKRKEPNEITCWQSGAVGMVLPVNEFISMLGTQFPPAPGTLLGRRPLPCTVLCKILHILEVTASNQIELAAFVELL